MRGSRVGAALVGVLLVSLVAAAPAFAAPTGGGTAAAVSDGGITPPQQTAGQAGPLVVQTGVDPDVVVLRASVDADGTASWTVAYRTRLDDENTTAAFDSVQSDIEANASAFTERFATGMRRTVRSAENATGREMALQNVTVDATREQLGQEYGVITYRFTWTNFAAVDGDRLRVGDALSGLFLDSETSLVVAWPEDYAVERAAPTPSENRTNEAVWHGQLDFGPNQPRLVLAPGGAGGAGPNTALLVGAGIAVVALAAAGWLVATRAREDDEPAADADRTADAGGAGAGDDSAAEPEEADAPPEELLSNEEKVIRLLEDNGGRVKQQQIAGEFDWTDAKTSQVVGTLRDDDAVETFRIGRENVVALPGESDL